MNNVIKRVGFVSKYFFAGIMLVYGIQHFMYSNFVARMIPGWVPFHHFWVYFTGSGLIAAAASIVLNWNAKWGCFFLGVMIWVFILIIHVPNLINDHFSAGDLTSACSDLGLASCAFMLSGILKN
jgi:putative oxidoreductase